MRFDYIIAATAAALTAPGVNAAPHAEVDISARSTVATNVALLKSVVVHPVQFCDWYLGMSRVASPFLRLGVSEVNAACKSIVGSKKIKKNAKLERAERKLAARGVSPKVNLAGCSTANVLKFESEWKADTHVPFCTFWLGRSRLASPFADLTVADLNSVCNCEIKDDTPAYCVASDVSAFKAVSSEPLAFCEWWQRVPSRPSSPSPAASLTVAQINNVCKCIIWSTANHGEYTKRDAKIVKKSKKSARAVHQYATASQMSTFNADWKNPKAFAAFWSSAPRTASPFTNLALAGVNNVVAQIKADEASSSSAAAASTSTTKTASSTASSKAASTTSASSKSASATSSALSSYASATSTAASSASSVASSVASSASSAISSASSAASSLLSVSVPLSTGVYSSSAATSVASVTPATSLSVSSYSSISVASSSAPTSSASSTSATVLSLPTSSSSSASLSVPVTSSVSTTSTSIAPYTTSMTSTFSTLSSTFYSNGTVTATTSTK